MPSSPFRTARSAAVLACALAVALAAPTAALARPATAELRVEAGGAPLVAGTSFVTDTARIQTDAAPGCGGSGRVATLRGPTALGLVAYATRVTRALRPIGVSDRFSFGLFLCNLRRFTGGDTRFWVYKVNHVSPEVGGDQYALRGGEQVLWYFEDVARSVNTGDELVVSAPARARSGHSFRVTVHAYDAAGRRRPAAGALVYGETVQRTRADGTATIFSDRVGGLSLRAVRGSDVPSAPVRVCLAERLSRCAAARGERVIGTNRADAIAGTRGPDEIDARGGDDRVRVRGGGTDHVRCGGGRDTVEADRHDRVARDCERVVRR